MRERDNEITVGLDEHGGAGVVAYEDVAEELLGSIENERDTAIALTAPTERAGSSTRHRLDKIPKVTGIERPEEDNYDNEEPASAMRRQQHGTALHHRNSPATSSTRAAGGRLTSHPDHLTPHQNERQMSVERPRRERGFQRQDIARNAHSAHNAHHPNPQVRLPLRPAPGSPRTPHGASSGTGRTPAASAPCPSGSTPGPVPAPPGRRPHRRSCGRPAPTGA